MHIEINDNVHLSQIVTQRSHSGGGIKLIKILTDFDEITHKKKEIGKPNRLLKSHMEDEDITSYLPGIDIKA